MMGRGLRVFDFGPNLVPYAAALRLQETLHALRKDDVIQDTLLLLQHHPVYTIGKRGKESDFKLPLDEIAMQRGGAAIHTAPRGGQVTFHGPGQLVAYPIMSLREVGRGARTFVEGLEDVVIRTNASFGVESRGRVPHATGVWVGERKIAALGIKISQGCSSHGLALNVSTNLSYFDAIVPCGIADKQVTSLELELGMLNSSDEVKRDLLARTSKHMVREFMIEFGSHLDVHRSLVSLEELENELSCS